MSDANRQWTQEETLQAISEKVREAGTDELVLNVLRRQGTILAAVTIATFEKATLEHVARPEVWLPDFAGGGQYEFVVMHRSDSVHRIGDRLRFNFKGEPTTVDVNAVVRPNWRGPTGLVYPSAEPRAPETFGSPRALAGAAPRTEASSEPPAGGQFRPATPAVADPAMAAAMADLTARQLALIQREQKLEIDAQRREQKAEADAARREQQAQQQAFEARMLALVEKVTNGQTAPRPATPDLTSTLTAVAGIVMPVVERFMSSAAEDRKAQAAQVAAMHQTQIEMIRAQTAKPPDPVLDRVLAKNDALVERLQNSQGGEMMTSVMKAMSAMTDMTLKTARIAAEIQSPQGETESSGLKIVKEIGKAVENAVGAMADASKARLRTAGAPAGATATGTQVPVGGTPPAPAPRPQRRTSMDDVEEDIRAMKDPGVVAARIVDLAQKDEPDFVKELSQHDNNIMQLAASRLSGWADENELHAPYLKRLFDEVIDRGTKAGVFTAEPPEGDEQPEAGA